MKHKNPIVKKETARSTNKQYTFFEDVYDVVRQIPKRTRYFFWRHCQLSGHENVCPNGRLGNEWSS